MLGKLILILLQVVVAWAVAPVIRKYIPVSGQLEWFILAAIYAVIVYVVGILAALVIKDVGTPSPAALTASLVLALVFAAIATFAWQYIPNIPNSSISKQGFILAGAILGYFIRR